MKNIAFILAFIILGTSVKAGSAIKYVVSAVNIELNSASCCSNSGDSNEYSCENTSSSEKEDCCKGPDCKCSCCMHIAFVSFLQIKSVLQLDFPDRVFGYAFDYNKDYLSNIFHPPALLDD